MNMKRKFLESFLRYSGKELKKKHLKKTLLAILVIACNPLGLYVSLTFYLKDYSLADKKC